MADEQQLQEAVSTSSHFVAANNNLRSSEEETITQPDDNDKKILEQKLKEKMEELSDLHKKHIEDRKKATRKYDDLSEQYQKKEHEISELKSKNSQLETQKMFAKERAESQKKEIANDINSYEKRIQILEQHKQMCEEATSKYEIDNKTLREKAFDNELKLRTAENRIESVKNDIKRLKIENKALYIQNSVEKNRKTKEEIEYLKRQNEREVEERELMKARNMITENATELEKWRTECHMLRDVHSKHNQEMQAQKDELNKYKDEVHHLKLAKDEAVKLMKICQLEFLASIKKLSESQQILESLDLQLDNSKCSETVNGSITNQSMTSNRSPQLSPARAQVNVFAVTSPESSSDVENVYGDASKNSNSNSPKDLKEPIKRTTQQQTASSFKRNGSFEIKRPKRLRKNNQKNGVPAERDMGNFQTDTEEDIINKTTSGGNDRLFPETPGSDLSQLHQLHPNSSTPTVESDHHPSRNTRKQTFTIKQL